jgi:hypothetical protein
MKKARWKGDRWRSNQREGMEALLNKNCGKGPPLVQPTEQTHPEMCANEKRIMENDESKKNRAKLRRDPDG